MHRLRNCVKIFVQVALQLTNESSTSQLKYSTEEELVDGGLRIVALGGLTEIGRNMTVFEYKSKLCSLSIGGVLFPERHSTGNWI
jgi:ribonuclease J